MNDAIKNILSRHSVRSFTDEKISDEDLKTIVNCGLHAPTAMNKQSFIFTVVRDEEIIKKLEKSIEKNMDRPNYSMYHSKCIIILSNDRENGNGYADCSCALENIFLGANALGIGSVWINQLKNTCDCPDTREILRSLNIPDSHMVWGTAALGYATTKDFEPKERTATVNYF